MALSRRKVFVASIALAGILSAPLGLAQPANEFARTNGGVTVYLGVLPAQIVKGHPTMHGSNPSGAHEYHIVAALFDAVSQTRISDAIVTAKISGLGLSGEEKILEPMNIADTVTFGGFFDLPGADLYTIKLSVRSPASRQPEVFNFKYDHRGQ